MSFSFFALLFPVSFKCILSTLEPLGDSSDNKNKIQLFIKELTVI